MFNRVRTDFKSIRTQITIGLLISGALVVFVTAFCGYCIFRKTLVNEIGNNRSDVLSQIGDRVRHVKNTAHLLSNLYYYDEHLKIEIGNVLEGREPGEALEAYLKEITGQYHQSLYDGELNYDVHLILENGWDFHSRKMEPDHKMKPKNKIWYMDMLRERGNSIEVANYREEKHSDESWFCVARAIFSEEESPMAYLLITVSERDIYNMYGRVVSGGGTLYIVDRNGTIISSSNQKINGFNFFNMDTLDELFLNREYTITRMRGEDILFTRYFDEGSEFTVLEEIVMKELLAPIRQVRSSVTEMAVVAVILVAAFAYMLGGYFARPLMRLCDFIQQIDENRLSEKCQVKGYTEINILSEKVNFLLVRIQMLLEGIRQKEKQKRKLELGFLQAQIQPHFMYNTLFSIKCMVDMEKNETASNMLASFIHLLRSMLSDPDQLVDVEKEFETLNEYAEILKFRSNGGFEVIFECEDRAKTMKIPKFLIQPLVENAIFHGIELKRGEGMILVVARTAGENLVVTVEDNGVGIAPEVMEQLKRGERVSQRMQIGIQNIRERIQLNFGAEYGLEIESRQWKGTKMTLKLPQIE